MSVPIMEDLHLRKFPPLEVAHKHLDFACLRNSANLSTQQQVIAHAEEEDEEKLIAFNSWTFTCIVDRG